MKISIPEYVKKAIAELNSRGFEAFVAGGAVRDALLGMSPDDWDITTNAHVFDVQNIFPRHFDTGIKHGTVTALVDGKPIEITTYRIEGDYENNRRPSSVEFTSNLSEDLKRRDFTINAMAYNDEKGLVDLFGGEDDLKNKVIRCVGNPDERFTEDALRIMRAVRFSSRLGFEIEPETLKSIQKNCHLLKNISAERVQSELVKTLLTGADVDILFSSGIMEIILPEISNNSKLVNSVFADKELKLSALFYGTEDALCRNLLNRLKFDNKTKYNVLQILKCSTMEIPDDEVSSRQMLRDFGDEILEKTILLWKICEKDVEKCENAERILSKTKLQPHSISMLAVDGNDLKNIGISGVEIGKTMAFLLDEVIKNPELNTKTQLLNLLSEK